MPADPEHQEDLSLFEEDEQELRKDIQRGLEDIEAGRVTPHEEVMRRLLDRYKVEPCQGALSLGALASPPACPEKSAERRQFHIQEGRAFGPMS
jgi:hypothetical protein